MRNMLTLATVLLLGCGLAAADVLAVKGDVVHTMAGDPIENGVVVVRDGKIDAVGPASRVAIPRDARVLEAAVVTPGLIDARTVVGLAGWLNQTQDQDQLERSAAMQPELRAIDAYNALDMLVDWVRGFGVTTVHTGHAPGALISGQTMIAKTRATNADDAVMVESAMVAATLGAGAARSGAKSPGNRSKAVAMLRQELIKADEYAAKRDNGDDEKAPARNLRLETLARVLDGEMPLMVTAHRYYDILAALRLAEEFDLRLVLDGAAEVQLVADRVAQAGVPVILHPTMARAVGEAENLSMASAAWLHEKGIPFALQSGYESYVPKTRVVLFEAAVAAAYGLGFDGALASVTIDAARLLGVDGRVGSLEPGKDGDLALYDGDPFEYTTHCIGTVIEGEVVAEGERRR